jgi:cell division protein FtsB
MQNDGGVGPGDAKTNLLSQLLGSGDQSIKLITLAMVIVSGGSNFWATKDAARVTDKEAQRAVDQLNDLHSQLDATTQRQKEMYEMIKKLSEEKQHG